MWSKAANYNEMKTCVVNGKERKEEKRKEKDRIDCKRPLKFKLHLRGSRIGSTWLGSFEMCGLWISWIWAIWKWRGNLNKQDENHTQIAWTINIVQMNEIGVRTSFGIRHRHHYNHRKHGTKYYFVICAYFFFLAALCHLLSFNLCLIGSIFDWIQTIYKTDGLFVCLCRWRLW